jgi:cytochrome c553
VTMSGRIACLVMVCVVAAAGSAAAAGKGSKEQVERGRYLVNLGGCNDCHSPKVFSAEGMAPDATRLLSGHPSDSKLADVDARAYAPGYWYLMGPHLTVFVGPWGTTYAANLTPDEQTGIGLWTEDIFIKALRTGKHMGDGRPIMPPMPWQSLAQVNDDDLKAIFAYLKSLPPIKNVVPAPVPPASPAGGSH